MNREKIVSNLGAWQQECIEKKFIEFYGIVFDSVRPYSIGQEFYNGKIPYRLILFIILTILYLAATSYTMIRCH